MKTEDANPEEKFSFDQIVHLLEFLWSKKKFIGTVTGAITLAAVVIALLLPPGFVTTASLMPNVDLSGMQGMGGISGLASLAGINLGEMGMEIIYPTVLQSETVLRDVLYSKYSTEKFDHPVDLVEYMGIKEKTPMRDFEVGIENLRGSTDVTFDRQTSVVTITVTAGEPQLAADIVNNTIAALDRFLRTKKITNATEQRIWIEKRLVEVQADLEKSEDLLRIFQEKNRMISGSPDLLMQQGRLIRDVTINSALFQELKTQYELKRIEELKSIPIVIVLDAGRPPAVRQKPKRRIIVTIAFILALGLSCGYVVFLDKHGSKVRRIATVFGIDRYLRKTGA